VVPTLSGEGRIVQLLRKFCQDESGQTAIEYGLILVLISLTIITSVQVFRDQLLVIFQNATNGFGK
jgi:Flp pilus assembly pilin Flp